MDKNFVSKLVLEPGYKKLLLHNMGNMYIDSCTGLDDIYIPL